MRAALLAVLLLAPSVSAQETPGWVGHFASGKQDVELALVPGAAAGELRGVLTLDETVFDLRGAARADGQLEGTGQPLVGGAVSFRLRVAGPDALTLGWKGFDVALKRVPGSSRAVPELRALIVRLSAPNGPAGEAAARAALEALAVAERLFREGDLEGDGKLDYGTLAEVVARQLVPEGFERQGGYELRVRVSPTEPEAKWMAVASPAEEGTGQRHFMINQTGAVWSSPTPIELTDACEPADGLKAESPPAPRPSPVRPGQRYTYALSTPGAPAMQMVYEVKAVEPARVRYTVQTLMDMGQGLAPVGDPQPVEWVTPPAGAPADAQPNVTTRRERVTISGVEFDCLVVTTGNTTTWLCMAGDVPAFPMFVKSLTDGQTTVELVKIE